MRNVPRSPKLRGCGPGLQVAGQAGHRKPAGRLLRYRGGRLGARKQDCWAAVGQGAPGTRRAFQPGIGAACSKVGSPAGADWKPARSSAPGASVLVPGFTWRLPRSKRSGELELAWAGCIGCVLRREAVPGDLGGTAGQTGSMGWREN